MKFVSPSLAVILLVSVSFSGQRAEEKDNNVIYLVHPGLQELGRAPAAGQVSDVFKLLPMLKDLHADDIAGIQERVRANIEKRIPNPKGTDPRTWTTRVNEQVTLISQYLAALRVDPEDLEQPQKVDKAEAKTLKAAPEAQREALAKEMTRRKKAAARIAPKAAVVLADDQEETNADDGDAPDAKDPESASESADDEDPRPSKLKLFSRLLESSMQFLECPDLTDWACLETTPKMTPKSATRKESAAFGAPIRAGAALDMEWYFNEGWDDKAPERRRFFLSEADPQFRPLLSQHLQSIPTPNPARWAFTGENAMAINPQQIPSFIPRNAILRLLDPRAFNAIDFAIYGIDDVSAVESKTPEGEVMKGSMKPVFDGLLGFRSAGHQVRGIVDITQAPRRAATRADAASTWLLSYLTPTSRLLGSWFFSPSDGSPSSPNFNGAVFQYNGTAELMRQLNWSDPQHPLQREEDSRVRVEWSPNNIMHNKFVVFKQGGRPSTVWTGTANFSAHCMGVEKNSNISLVIKNPFIAATYQAEFEHMFNFFPNNAIKSDKIRGTGAVLPVGRFHRNKVPVAPRLFVFDDGTQLRVHFAPTDDGEHRSALPMIHSANTGDTVRISMFGNSGYEYIRAIQLAVARGVNVRLVLDSQQAAGAFSWLKDPSGNLLEANPYFDDLCKNKIRPGTLSIKVSGWTGKNHYKAATLTRKSGIVEAMIVGSQNWSTGGNDANDENMVSMQNKRIGLRIGRQFNLEFEHLSEAARPPFQRAVPELPVSCRQLMATGR